MKSLAVALLLGMSVTLAGPAVATDADDAIKYRKQVMGTIGDQMKSIVQILKGEAGSPEAMASHTQAMALMASLSKAAFEQNTAGEGSETTTSKPNIWENWEDYAAKTDAFEQAVIAMNEAAQAGDMAGVGGQLRTVGGACQECHKEYRTD